jgi:hypothetical protein
MEAVKGPYRVTRIQLPEGSMRIETAGCSPPRPLGAGEEIPEVGATCG